MAEGDLAAAVFWHPLILLTLAILPYLAVRHVIFKKKPVSGAEKNIFLGIGFLYITVFVVRMIMYFPHTPPMVMYEDTVARRLLYIFFGV